MDINKFQLKGPLHGQGTQLRSSLSESLHKQQQQPQEGQHGHDGGV